MKRTLPTRRQKPGATPTVATAEAVAEQSDPFRQIRWLIWLRIELANWGTRTQGKIRKRVLLATPPNWPARAAALQPIH